jgi:hypothetical protein
VGWLHQDGTTGLPLKLRAPLTGEIAPQAPCLTVRPQGEQVEAIEGEDACKRRVTSSSPAPAEAAAYIQKCERRPRCFARAAFAWP